MNEDLKNLYRELGYTGAFPQPRSETRGGEMAPPQWDPKELAPLDKAGLEIIETLLKDHPAETLAQLKAANNYPVEDKIILEAIQDARRAFDSPGKFVEERRTRQAAEKATSGRRTRGLFVPTPKIPDEFILYPDIPMEPDSHKFEPRADALGWVFNSIYYVARDKMNPGYLKAKFPLHHEFPSNFIYDLKDREGKPAAPDQRITIALFADFGTGLYHSKYIARNIAALAPDYAIHLGDVYYAGRNSEFRYYFEEPLEQVLRNARTFTMNSNHEMFSAAFPYFAYIDYKRKQKIGWMKQDQEGSYFCIRNAKYQIIGIDTAFHEDGRHQEAALQTWLGERLWEGKKANPKRTNILLSPNEPYEFGKAEFTGLYDDLEKFINEKLIDFWFWGNTHYCTLFKKSGKAPFVGSCIGHGGHPIYKRDVEKNEAEHKKIVKKNNGVPAAEWVDLSPKFPVRGLREDLANHGFCMMDLESQGIRLTYYDWLKRVQHTAEFPLK